MNKDYLHLLFNKQRTYKCNQYLKMYNDNNLKDCYLYNIELSKTFYYLLHTLELVLKNTFNNAFSQENINWLISDDFLEDFEKRKIKDIIKKFELSKNEISNDSILEKLEFGFFTGLFNKRYEKKIWHKYIEYIFPNIDKINKSRYKLLKRIIKLKNLRNKIAHHEPIYYWTNLSQYHNEIIEFIGWINKDIKYFTLQYDNFNDIIKLNIKEEK